MATERTALSTQSGNVPSLSLGTACRCCAWQFAPAAEQHSPRTGRSVAHRHRRDATRISLQRGRGCARRRTAEQRQRRASAHLQAAKAGMVPKDSRRRTRRRKPLAAPPWRRWQRPRFRLASPALVCPASGGEGRTVVLPAGAAPTEAPSTPRGPRPRRLRRNPLRTAPISPRNRTPPGATGETRTSRASARCRRRPLWGYRWSRLCSREDDDRSALAAVIHRARGRRSPPPPAQTPRQAPGTPPPQPPSPLAHDAPDRSPPRSPTPSTTCPAAAAPPSQVVAVAGGIGHAQLEHAIVVALAIGSWRTARTLYNPCSTRARNVVFSLAARPLLFLRGRRQAP